MPDFLAGMAIASRRRVGAAKRRISLAGIRGMAADVRPAPSLVLSSHGFDVIAEIKRRAPVGGAADGVVLERLAEAYVAGGAAAVSVLTEPLAFDGSLEDLATTSRVLAGSDRPIPTMRKDFLVDPYQVFEARAAGAGGVLLIADLLIPVGHGVHGPAGSTATVGEATNADPNALLDAAAETGVWVLIEAFDDGRIEPAVNLARRAVERGVQAFVGVNVRDLRTLAVDRGRLARVAGKLPNDLPCVAESGMLTGDDVAAAAQLGYGLALVGRALSRAPDPRGLLIDMLRAGRAARREAAWT